MQAQSNDASMYCIERDVFIAATINLGSQPDLHVSPITALLRSMQLPATRVDSEVRVRWVIVRARCDLIRIGEAEVFHERA
jgi:hypothetical protein